jgi:tellurite resistance protein TerC
LPQELLLASDRNWCGEVNLPLSVWVITITVFLVVIGADLLIADRRPQILSTKEASGWVLFYVSLAIILGFIGVKLVFHAMAKTPSLNWEFEISLQVSLLVIGLTLATTTVASLLRTRQLNSIAGE